METTNYDQMNLDFTEKKSGIIVEKDVLTAYTYEDRFAVVPAGVKKINCDDNIFSPTATERIILPNSLHLIKGVTGLEHLLSFEVPYGVKTIEERCFAGCKEIMYITLPETVTRIKAGAFSGCTKLKSINIPESAATLKSDMFDLAASGEEESIYPELTIYGVKGSAAEKYAAKYGFKFEEGLPEKVPAPRTENDPRYSDEIIQALMENNDAMRSSDKEPVNKIEDVETPAVVEEASTDIAESTVDSVSEVVPAPSATVVPIKTIHVNTPSTHTEPTTDTATEPVAVATPTTIVTPVTPATPTTPVTSTTSATNETPTPQTTTMESPVVNYIDFSDRLKAEFNIGVPWVEEETKPQVAKKKKGFFARLFGSK